MGLATRLQRLEDRWAPPAPLPAPAVFPPMTDEEIAAVAALLIECGVCDDPALPGVPSIDEQMRRMHEQALHPTLGAAE